MSRAEQSTIALGDALHPYVPVRRPVTPDGDALYGPPCATEEEAEQWIADYERRNGCEPGCDSGFGAGSGFVVEVAS